MMELFATIQKDLFRILGVKKKWFGMIFNLYQPEFCFLFFYRIAAYHYEKNNKKRLFFFKFFYRHFSIIYGYEIPFQCKIEPGLRLVHRGGIIINPSAKIGKNVTLFRGCTIGSNRRGKNKGAPILSENVWVGANAAIIGNVNIGRNVMIAPNSYVNFDVPENSICIGNPAKIIKSENATEFYIDNII